MALSYTLKALTPYGEVQVPDCYLRAANVTIAKTEAEVRVVFLRSSEGGQMQEARYVFPYDLAGDNPIKQAYEHLKTLPEFADAVDC